MQKRLVFFCSLFFLVAIPAVFAIGLSPSPIHIEYQPGKEEEFTFSIMNNQGNEVYAHLYASGEYASLLTFKETIIKIPAYQAYEVKAKIRFPEAILTPGPQHIKIGVIEEPADNIQAQGVIPKAGVETKLKFAVPYPGKYLQLRLEVPSVNAGERLPVQLFIKSYGKETVERLSGSIALEAAQQVLKTIPVSLHEILPDEERSFQDFVKTEDMPAGDYMATGIFAYDRFQGFASTDFRIGTLYVNLTNFTKTFERDTVAQLDLHIASRWNENIDDVYATIEIMQDGRGVASMQTPGVSLNPWQTAILRTYWDTNGIAQGNYQARITLHYAQTSSVFDGDLVVYAKIKVNTTYILIGIIAFIILVDVIWLLRKKKRSRL